MMMNPWMSNWMNQWKGFQNGLSGLGASSPPGGNGFMMSPGGGTLVNGQPPTGYQYHYPRGSMPPMGNLPPPWGTGSQMPIAPPTGTMLSAPPGQPLSPPQGTMTAPPAQPQNSFVSSPTGGSQQPQSPDSSGGGQALMGRGKYPLTGMTSIGNMPKNNGVA